MTDTIRSTQSTATAPTTSSGARKRLDHSLVGQLNLEWAQLRNASTGARAASAWAADVPALAGCASLADVEARVADADRPTADAILLALLEFAAASDPLAGRTVLQLMLGKAVRIAAGHNGRADRDTLEQLAVAALWDVIATYPISRRRQKVAANLAMDTLRQVSLELGHDKHETPVETTVLAQAVTADDDDLMPDQELFEVLAWGVDAGAISRADAALVAAVYCTGPDNPGGAAAAAEFGLSWAAARQRCSRAIRRLAAAVRTDADHGAAELTDRLAA